MKITAALAMIPACSAFVAPAGPKMARGRSMKMNFGYEEGGLPVGGVTFPDSAQKWVSINQFSRGRRRKQKFARRESTLLEVKTSIPLQSLL
jgi:hypothetical protein